MFHFFCFLYCFCSCHKQPLKYVTTVIRLPPNLHFLSTQPANSSVIDFGAVSDNVCYDTDTIHAAMNSCPKSSWCHVIFPTSGTWWQRYSWGCESTGPGGGRCEGGVMSQTRDENETMIYNQKCFLILTSWKWKQDMKIEYVFAYPKILP